MANFQTKYLENGNRYVKTKLNFEKLNEREILGEQHTAGREFRKKSLGIQRKNLKFSLWLFYKTLPFCPELILGLLRDIFEFSQSQNNRELVTEYFKKI